MSKADDVFWRQFGIILVLITLFTFAMFFLARDIGGDAIQSMINSPSAVAERIKPVAQVRVGNPEDVVAAQPVAAAAAAPAVATSAEADGEAVYNAACVACHAAGVAGAPKLGDKDAWSSRVGAGEDALVASVVNGKGAMPAKAGNPALTDAEIVAAVRYMLEAVGAGSTASTETAPAAAAAPAAADESATQTTEAAASDAAPAAQTTAAAGQAGDAVYNGVCVACHLVGAAGAPKLDDKAAWATRAANGVDAMVANVVNGKGAMPAKGGNPALQDADIRNAVQYILDQAGVIPGS